MSSRVNYPALYEVGRGSSPRNDLKRGAEPDSSYYIQNESLVRNQENIDLTTDPPPDLVLEVEYARSAIDKLMLYASMEVPEVWRFNGDQLQVYTLAEQKYTEVELSPTFNPIPIKAITHFLQQVKTKGEIAVTRDFKAWIKQQIPR